MSAECHRCGWDLPFYGECVVCEARDKATQAEAALEQAYAQLNDPTWGAKYARTQAKLTIRAALNKERAGG